MPTRFKRGRRAFFEHHELECASTVFYPCCLQRRIVMRASIEPAPMLAPSMLDPRRHANIRLTCGRVANSVSTLQSCKVSDHLLVMQAESIGNQTFSSSRSGAGSDCICSGRGHSCRAAQPPIDDAGTPSRTPATDTCALHSSARSHRIAWCSRGLHFDLPSFAPPHTTFESVLHNQTQHMPPPRKFKRTLNSLIVSPLAGIRGPSRLRLLHRTQTASLAAALHLPYPR
jgi:hypothetical protein